MIARARFALALAAGASALALGSAEAATRIWVSAHGVDQAGCGAPTAPCRSLQYAHDNIASGGEVDVLDPGGYGSVTISKAISIVNDGVGTVGVQSTSGTAVTINATTNDKIYLKGLNIDGVGTALTGVQFNSGASLTLANCVIQHFLAEGIEFAPSAGTVYLRITDTSSSNNGDNGFRFFPVSGSATVNATIDRSQFDNNSTGIYLKPDTGASSAKFFIRNSDISENSSTGFFTESSVLNLTTFIEDSHIELNGSSGLFAETKSVTHLSRSYVDSNLSIGVLISTTAPAGVFSSADNVILDNGGAQVSGTLGTDVHQ